MAATVWSTRTPGYKLGVLVLFLGSALYVVGYAVPFWIDVKSDKWTHRFFGLWHICWTPRSSDRTCYPVNDFMDDWFRAVQATESVGLIGLFVAGLYVLIVNCCRNISTAAKHHRFLEILSAFSGMCGFVGCIVFVAKLQEDLRNVSVEDELGWGFGFSLAGSIQVVAASAVIFCTDRADTPRPAHHRPYPGAVFHSRGVPAPGRISDVELQSQRYHPSHGRQSYSYSCPQPGVLGSVAQAGYGDYPQTGSGTSQSPDGGNGSAFAMAAAAPPPPPLPKAGDVDDAPFGTTTETAGGYSFYNQGYNTAEVGGQGKE